MQAIPGGTATHHRLDAHKRAGLLRGGMRPQASAYPAARRATRALRRRRRPLLRKRAALFAHGHHTNRQDNRPEIGQTRASKANRQGVAARVAEPAGQQRIAVALARSAHDDPRLTNLAFASVNTATPHDAHTCSRLRSGPGLGQRLRLVRLDDIQDLRRCPRGQACVSSWRLITWAKASAGKRLGTAGTTMGQAVLKWACSDAAVLFWRDNPAAQQSLARRETHHGQGQALTLLAHTLARALYSRLKRDPAFARHQFLHGDWRGVGEPRASRDDSGISLDTALCNA